MENIVYTIIIVTVIIMAFYMLFDNKHLIFYGDNKINGTEGFNDQNGFYCSSCENKTLNQCLRCFNCGFADFADGTGQCMEGGEKGPFKKVQQQDKIDKYSSLNNDGSYYGLYKTNTNDVFPNKKINYYLWKDNYKFPQKKGKVINRWYHIDPFSYMRQRADDFECAKPKINNNNKLLIY